MEFNEKIKRLEVNQKLQNRLKEIGIYNTIPLIGPTGPQGEIGPQGPSGEEGPTSHPAVLFVSYAETNYSRTMPIQESKMIPADNNIFYIPNNTDITIIQEGTYEITLCGIISGVTTSNGGIFLLNDETGKVVQDLSFNLPAGNTSVVNFSEVIITDLKASTTLSVRCGITGDQSTSGIKFTCVNLVVKKFKM